MFKHIILPLTSFQAFPTLTQFYCSMKAKRTYSIKAINCKKSQSLKVKYSALLSAEAYRNYQAFIYYYEVDVQTIYLHY